MIDRYLSQIKPLLAAPSICEGWMGLKSRPPGPFVWPQIINYVERISPPRVLFKLDYPTLFEESFPRLARQKILLYSLQFISLNRGSKHGKMPFEMRPLKTWSSRETGGSTSRLDVGLAGPFAESARSLVYVTTDIRVFGYIPIYPISTPPPLFFSFDWPACKHTHT